MAFLFTQHPDHTHLCHTAPPSSSCSLSRRCYLLSISRAIPLSLVCPPPPLRTPRVTIKASLQVPCPQPFLSDFFPPHTEVPPTSNPIMVSTTPIRNLHLSRGCRKAWHGLVPVYLLEVTHSWLSLLPQLLPRLLPYSPAGLAFYPRTGHAHSSFRVSVGCPLGHRAPRTPPPPTGSPLGLNFGVSGNTFPVPLKEPAPPAALGTSPGSPHCLEWLLLGPQYPPTPTPCSLQFSPWSHHPGP